MNSYSAAFVVKLSNANNYLRIKLQQLAVAHGLRLVTVMCGRAGESSRVKYHFRIPHIPYHSILIKL